eukprot:366014-Chlamydomonas_euryale.AAC.8
MGIMQLQRSVHDAMSEHADRRARVGRESPRQPLPRAAGKGCVRLRRLCTAAGSCRCSSPSPARWRSRDSSCRRRHGLPLCLQSVKSHACSL